jgi:hypothetical protein
MRYCRQSRFRFNQNGHRKILRGTWRSNDLGVHPQPNVVSECLAFGIPFSNLGPETSWPDWRSSVSAGRNTNVSIHIRYCAQAWPSAGRNNPNISYSFLQSRKVICFSPILTKLSTRVFQHFSDLEPPRRPRSYKILHFTEPHGSILH